MVSVYSPWGLFTRSRDPQSSGVTCCTSNLGLIVVDCEIYQHKAQIELNPIAAILQHFPGNKSHGIQWHFQVDMHRIMLKSCFLHAASFSVLKLWCIQPQFRGSRFELDDRKKVFTSQHLEQSCKPYLLPPCCSEAVGVEIVYPMAIGWNGVDAYNRAHSHRAQNGSHGDPYWTQWIRVMAAEFLALAVVEANMTTTR